MYAGQETRTKARAMKTMRTSENFIIQNVSATTWKKNIGCNDLLDEFSTDQNLGHKID